MTEPLNALRPTTCPAGKCDALLYSSGEFCFCPKCGGRNPNYHSRVGTKVDIKSSQQPLVILDPETGVLKQV